MKDKNTDGELCRRNAYCGTLYDRNFIIGAIYQSIYEMETSTAIISF